VLVRAGRFGAYVQLGEGGGKDKPKTCSLLRTMSAETVTLEQACQLLTLPREVGVDPQSGEPISAQLGRYGPYLTRGAQSRTLANEEAVFTITLPEALALFAQPKQGRGRRNSGPLAELGVDPESGRAITLREGPFGPYVSDGEINAALRKGDAAEGLSLERAQELLRLRRERGPVSRKRGKPVKARSAAPRRKPASKTGGPKPGKAKRRPSAKGTTAKSSSVSPGSAKPKPKPKAKAKSKAKAKKPTDGKAVASRPGRGQKRPGAAASADAAAEAQPSQPNGSASTGASRADRTRPTEAPSALDG